MLLAFIMAMYPFAHTSYALNVSFLTRAGPMVLKSWSPAELKKLSSRGGEISAQKLIFDESTQTLNLNDRADVDLVTICGEHETARVPRFMIWRGFFKLKVAHDGKLKSVGESNRLLVPSSIFTVQNIQRIELTRASLVYPNTELHLRTNPAASRGEKLFSQSCLACHSLSSTPKLKPDDLTPELLAHFDAKHKKFGISLDAKAARGLIAYRDALVKEHSEVKSTP